MFLVSNKINDIQTDPKLNAAKNKFTRVICLRMEKNHQGKTPSDEFKITTPENLLLSKQAVTSKRNLNT